MFSMKAKYAIKALVFLARHRNNGYTLAAELAMRESMPRKFLETILLDLKSRGFLQSRKGRGGGYSFIGDPGAISISQIVEGIDGPMTTPCCVSQSAVRTCERCDEMGCALRNVMESVCGALTEVLERTTLSDLIASTEQIQSGQSSTGVYEI